MVGNLLGQVETVIHEITADLSSIASSLGEIASEIGCFVAGTLIRTETGDVAVEDLQVGDIAVTASGAHRPIRWLGHRSVDCTRHPNRKWALPVQIAAGAFGPNKPERPLLVSPGHALCLNVFEELLIPAYTLINDATVSQLNVAQVTYWHVELDSHDMLIANGVPAESYYEVGNREFFLESQTVAIDGLPDGGKIAPNAYCRPLVDKGPVIDALRERMRYRALALDWALSNDALGGLHVVADGVRMDADASGLSARFVLSAKTKEVWLVSDTWVPYNCGLQDDRRILGVAVAALAVDDGLGTQRTLGPGDPLLADGFHGLQDGADGPHRWTDGRVRLPSELWQDCRGVFFLRVDLAMPAGKRWIAPPVFSATEDSNVVAFAS